MSHYYKSSLYLLFRHIDEKIAEGNLNESLKLIHDSVVQIISEPVCTAKIFGSEILDHLCLKIGQHCFDQNFSSYPKQEKVDVDYIYLVTKLQESGGHTRVIRNFITARPNEKHLIISTELAGRSNRDFLSETIPSEIDFSIQFAPKGNYVAKLIWLQAFLMQLNAKKIYLFNHHQDAVIIAAVQSSNIKCSFYHHADHQLCLGSTISCHEHIDINPLIYQRCRRTGIDNIYIPLTVKDKGEPVKEKLFRSSGFLITCTVARFNKIEKSYFINYFDVITELLSNTGGMHIHIGTLTPWARWKLKYQLKKNKISSRRFLYIPWVADVWKALQDLDVDLYISSFPYGAGLTLIEVMGAGVPVAIHRNVFSNHLSEFSLAYNNAFSWQFPEQLIQYCKMVTAADLQKHRLAGRHHYLAYFKDDKLASLLDGSDKVFPPIVSDVSEQYAANEYAYWLCRQFNFISYLNKFCFKCAKKIRTLIK